MKFRLRNAEVVKETEKACLLRIEAQVDFESKIVEQWFPRKSLEIGENEIYCYIEDLIIGKEEYLSNWVFGKRRVSLCE